MSILLKKTQAEKTRMLISLKTSLQDLGISKICGGMGKFGFCQINKIDYIINFILAGSTMFTKGDLLIEIEQMHPNNDNTRLYMDGYKLENMKDVFEHFQLNEPCFDIEIKNNDLFDTIRKEERYIFKSLITK